MVNKNFIVFLNFLEFYGKKDEVLNKLRSLQLRPTFFANECKYAIEYSLATDVLILYNLTYNTMNSYKGGYKYIFGDTKGG